MAISALTMLSSHGSLVDARLAPGGPAQPQAAGGARPPPCVTGGIVTTKQAKPRADASLTWKCAHPECGSLFAHYDSARKHARIKHPQWVSRGRRARRSARGCRRLRRAARTARTERSPA